jgi:ribonuclease P protein component
MITKKRKLSRVDFPSFREARFVVSGSVLRFALYKRSDPVSPTRCAVVVGKKYYPNIVERNRFKRRVFASIATLLPECDRGHYDRIVITPLCSVEQINVSEIASDLVLLKQRIT